MTLRDFLPRIKDAHIRTIAGLSRFYNRAPDELNNDDIQTCLRHSGMGPPIKAGHA